MLSKSAYETRELPPYQHTVLGKDYRKFLCHTSRVAVWIFNLYFTIRVTLIASDPRQTWQMWLMVLVEWIFARLSRHDQLLTVASDRESICASRKRLRLQGSSETLPLVDVLVPCCGEPVEVILDTVSAACTLDYPASRFRVLVLDDGGSSELSHAVTKLRSTWPHLSYHTRGQHSGRVFAKAGNLNYAIFTLQDKIQPEYCVIFDADCLPTPDFLRATLPHLLQRPQAALLTTRQYYYNLPAGDPLSQSRIYFYACHNTELDMQGIALDAGSGAIFRRQAIVDAGGYPTFSFSEDWQLSLILKGLGYEIIQVEEMLQLGLVPTSMDGHIAQRNRWNIGHSQQINVLRPPANKNIPQRLQWSIAVGGIVIVLGLLGFFLGFLAVPILLVSGPLIPLSSVLMVKVQVILAVAHMALTWLHSWLQVTHTGRRVKLFSNLENSWLAATQIYAIIRFHLFSNKPKGSFVTGSSANAWNRHITGSSLYKKLYRDLWANGIIYSASLFLLILGTTLYSISKGVGSSSSTNPNLAIRLLTTVAWPPMLHLLYLSISNLWVPVSYLISPPQYPERTSRMSRTERGVLFPKREVQAEILRQTSSRFHFLWAPLTAACLLMVILFTALFVL